MRDLLIHIHGFLSANNADRVVALQKYVEANGLAIDVISPRLSDTPEAAIQQLEQLILTERNNYRSIGLVGYSLGGYFATYLAEKYDLRAVLVNPVVRGYEIMCEFFGECFNEHTGVQFEIGEQDIQFLVSLYLDELAQPQRFLVMLQMADGIVDPQEALAYYAQSQLLVEDEGCHEFEGFERHVATAINFLFDNVLFNQGRHGQ